MDFLRRLESKEEVLVDKMISAKVHNHQLGVVSNEGMRLLLKWPWDPTTYMECDPGLNPLPGEPIVVLTSTQPSFGVPGCGKSKRAKNFLSMWF